MVLIGFFILVYFDYWFQDLQNNSGCKCPEHSGGHHETPPSICYIKEDTNDFSIYFTLHVFVLKVF